MPDCEYFEELCSLSLDGALTRAEKRELDAHLAECPACAAYLEDLKFMRTAWGDIKEPLPEALHEKIMSGVMEEVQAKAEPQKKKRRPPVFTMIAAAAACVMLVLSGAVGDMIGDFGVEDPGPAAEGRSTDEPDAAMEAVPEVMTELQPSSEAAPDEAAAPQPEAQPYLAPADGGKEEDVQQPAASVPETSGKQSRGAVSSENDAQPGVAVHFAQGDAPEKNAAAELAVTLPDNLLATGYGFCYVAVGSGEPPALEEARLMEKDGGTYYFRIPNSVSSLDGLRTLLQDAGYETALRTDVGITTDENAKFSLLIVQVKE